MLCQVVEIVDGGVVSGWCHIYIYIYIYIYIDVSEDLAVEYLGVIVIMNND